MLLISQGITGAVITGSTPNLNGNAYFLRGAPPGVSGLFQDDQMQGHNHVINSNSHTHSTQIPNSGVSVEAGNDYAVLRTSGTGGVTSTTNTHSHTMGSIVTDGSNGNPRVGAETRPKNMAVVWLMRVK